MPATADSPESIRLARRWLDDCLHNHRSCLSCLDMGPPTRLVDVGPPDGSRNPRLLLDIDSNGGEQNDLTGFSSPYLTLSHCWGKTASNAPWKTTQANLAAFSTSIPMEILPKTLYDAIQFTRLLGERYIWIDSLCIIQDSSEDWAKEAATMGLTYSNSLCTLIASSDSADGGCFSDRNVLKISVTTLTLTSKDRSTTQEVTISPHAPHRMNLVAESPTRSRAWCLQEAELSPRIIHFTKYQTLWECFQSHASELADDDFTDAPDERQSAVLYNMVNAHHARIGWADTAIGYNHWYSLVENYSTRNLTFGGDKLPALAGMAERTQLALTENDSDNERYVAGLWERDLLVGLLWKNPGLSRGAKEFQESIAEYVAPSWSWASTRGPVEFPLNKERFVKLNLHTWRPSTIKSDDSVYGNNDTALASTREKNPSGIIDYLRIYHASIHPLTVNPFGQVQCGHLYAEGRLKRMEAKRLDEEVGILFLKDLAANKDIGTLTFDFNIRGQDYPDIWFLLVQSLDPGHGREVLGVGLALVPAPVEQNATSRYRRIGFVEVPLSWYNEVGDSYLTIV